MRILFVCSSSANVGVLKRALVARGFESIRCVTSRPAAIHALDGGVDLVILDSKFGPCEPDGAPIVLDHIRRLSGKPLSVLMTEKQTDEELCTAERFGALYVVKSASVGVLADLLALAGRLAVAPRTPSGVRERVSPEEGQAQDRGTLLADAADAASRLGPKLAENLTAIEDHAIKRTLEAHGGKLRPTARALGLERRSLQYRLRQRKR